MKIANICKINSRGVAAEASTSLNNYWRLSQCQIQTCHRCLRRLSFLIHTILLHLLLCLPFKRWTDTLFIRFHDGTLSRWHEWDYLFYRMKKSVTAWIKFMGQFSAKSPVRFITLKQLFLGLLFIYFCLNIFIFKNHANFWLFC